MKDENVIEEEKTEAPASESKPKLNRAQRRKMLRMLLSKKKRGRARW